MDQFCFRTKNIEEWKKYQGKEKMQEKYTTTTNINSRTVLKIEWYANIALDVNF